MDSDKPGDGDASDEELLSHARPVVVAAIGRVHVDRRGLHVTPPRVRRASTPDELSALARSFANRGGRTDDSEGRLASYRVAILALADKGYATAAITAGEILKAVHRVGSESQLYADVSTEGGLKAFRAEVLRSR